MGRTDRKTPASPVPGWWLLQDGMARTLRWSQELAPHRAPLRRHGLEINPYRAASAGAAGSAAPLAGFHLVPRSLLAGAAPCGRARLCLSTAAVLSPRSHPVRFPSVCTAPGGGGSRCRWHRPYPRAVSGAPRLLCQMSPETQRSAVFLRERSKRAKRN